MLELTSKIAFGIAQENKLTVLVLLLDHLAHAVNMVKELGCTGECGEILSLVLACSEHPYPKPAYLQLLFVSSSTSLICVPYGQDCDSPAHQSAGEA